MEERRTQTVRPSAPVHRICFRTGCGVPVKKPLGKYCSVRCCSIDPQRHERLRVQARLASRRPVLPMARQLSLGLAGSANPEAFLAHLCEGREDAPGGLSRLVV
jgi:hypothetical protein